MKKRLIILMLLFSIAISGLTGCMHHTNYLADKDDDGEIELHFIEVLLEA